MIFSEDINNYYHNNYNIDDTFKKWKKGGYASVLLSDSGTLVLKKMYKYETDSDTKVLHISYPTILEGCLTKALSYHSCFTKLNYMSTSAKHLYICQEYMGVPFHTFAKNVQDEDIPLLIYRLIKACCIMIKNGIQHTDIKPTNVLINTENNTVHIIDYNCMSIQKVMNNTVYWQDGIGTWQYVSPEILFEQKVHTNSSVWSIGLLLTQLLKCFPLHPKFYSHIPPQNSEKLEDWVVIMEKIIQEDGEHNLFHKIYKHVPKIYEPFLKRMFTYNPYLRYPIEQLLEDWKNEFQLEESIDTSMYHSIEVLPYIGYTKFTRALLFELMYQFCKKWDQLYKFSLILHIFDHCSSMITPKTEKQLLFGAWAISTLLLNEHLNEHIDLFRTIHTVYGVDIPQICDMIWIICDHLEWNIYEKTVDVWILELGYPVDYKNLLQLFVNQTEKYSMKSLAERYISVYHQTS